MVIKVLQQRRKSLAARFRHLTSKDDNGVGGDRQYDGDDVDIDDDATALEIALHESTTTTTHHQQQCRSSGDRIVGAASAPPVLLPSLSTSTAPVDAAGQLRSLPRSTSNMERETEVLAPYQVLETRDDMEGGVMSQQLVSSMAEARSSSRTRTRSKSKNKSTDKLVGSSRSKKGRSTKRSNEAKLADSRGRSFHIGSTDSRDMGPITSQIRLTTALLTGLVSIADKTKRRASTKNNGTASSTNDEVTGYVRLVSSRTIKLAANSPDVVKSLPIPPTAEGMTTARTAQSFVIWTNDDPSNSGSLIVETRGSSKEPIINLEIGVISCGKMIPLGTASFHPGMTEISDRRRHIKVEKVRKLHGNGLFRKKQPNESDFRLSKDSFLSIKIDVKPGSQETNFVSEEDAMNLLRRPITSEGLERAFSSASLNSHDHLVSQTNQNFTLSAAVLGFFTLVCCWCFGDDNDAKTSGGKELETDDETAQESVGDNTGSNHEMKGVAASSPICCCTGGNSTTIDQQQSGTEIELTFDQSTAVSADVTTDGDTTFVDDKSRTESHTMDASKVATHAWSFPFSICCLGSGQPLPVVDKDLDLDKIGTAEPNDTVPTPNEDIEVSNSADKPVGRSPRFCAACFGDADVDEIKVVQNQSVSGAQQQRDTFPSSESFAGTVMSQMPRTTFCAAWCGEEDVEQLKPVPIKPVESQKSTKDERSVVGGSSKPTNDDADRQLPVDVVGCEEDKDLRKAALTWSQDVEDLAYNHPNASGNETAMDTVNETLFESSTDERTTDASSYTRPSGDAEDDDDANSQHSADNATSYSTSYASTRHEQSESVGCFPFMTGIGAEAEDSASAASCDSSTNTGYSLSATTHCQQNEEHRDY